jgi:hypothetical protein
MKKNYFLLLCSLLLGAAIQAQVSYTGNGNSGFGSPVGGATMTINDDGTTITCTFTKGAGDFNDTMVMYIANGSSGRNVINGDVNDANDSNRRAISNTGSGDLTLPTGFQATHAASINTGFGGLWSIPATGTIGNNGLGFVTAVGGPSAGTDASFSFTFTWANIGLTNTDKFDFVIVYGNPNDGGSNMFSSDEGFGSITAGNPGTSAYSVTTDHSYPNTWTGATDNDWATASNWTEGVPTSTHNVHIPSGLTNYPTASSAVTVNKGTVKSGASLINESTFSGTMTIERDLPTNNWYLLSTPVTGESKTDMIANNDFDNTTGTGSNIGFGFYDNSLAGNQWTYATASTTGSLFDTGYAVKLNSAGTVSITGSLRSGGANVSESISSDVTNFNLIGNVFQAYLAANENADATNSLLSFNNGKLTENTIWLWNQGSGTYTQVNQATSAFHIAPMQGFFVSVSSNQSFIFPTASRSHQSTDTFQKSATTKPEVKLFMTDGSLNRDTEIYYIDGKTTGFDNGYDSSIFGGTTHEFTVYTEAVENSDGKKLGIQSLPNSDFENMVIPIGVIADTGKEITFTAEALNLPSGIKVFLEDRENNTVTRLDEANSNYKVTLNTALNGTGRFFLHTRSAALSTDDVALTGVGIYTVNKNTLRVNGINSDKASIKIYNILGKKVVDNSFSSKGVTDFSLPNLSTGIYIVQLATENGNISKKIVLE